MAIVLRGKAKGAVVKILQFCNDWIMTENGILSPTSLEYNVDEIERLANEKSGIMFGLYQFKGNRLIKRKSCPETNR